VAPGGTATLTAAASGTSSISYEWKKNGVVVEGEIDSTLVIENVQISDQGGYSVVIRSGSYEFESSIAPLIVNREVGWRWTHRVGGTSDDSALSLANGINTLWVGGEHNGQFLRHLNPITGAQVVNHQISINGDGASAVCTDGVGRIMVGANLEQTNPYSRPALLQLRQGSSATVLWSRALATEKGGTDAPNGYADTTAVCPDGLGNVLAAGYFVGRGRFGTLPAGVVGNTSICGFLVKYNDAGTPLWVRDVRSNDDEDDCRINDMAVDGSGDIYVTGVLGLNGRLQRSATATDRTAALTTTFRRPFVAKYSNAGAHQWTYSPEQSGEFLSVAADAAGNIWATGYVGPADDITSRGGLLYRLNRLTGAVIEFKEVDEVTGCAIRTQGLNAFWLALDATGNSTIGGVKWGVTGYRCIMMSNLTINLTSPTWEVPAFGGVGARSDEAEAVIAPDGAISVALNFTQSPAEDSIRFPRRAPLSLIGRARDGVVAQIGELPLITSDPTSKIIAAGTDVTLSLTVGGTQISTVQWLKAAKDISGQITNSLTLRAAKLTDSGSYFAKVTKGGNVVDSSTAEVVVVNTTLPNVTQTAGKAMTLTCSASGPNLTYQWLKNGTPLNGDTRVRGVNTSTLTISDLVAPDSASYICRVTATAGSLNTNASLVTVVLPPAIQEFAFDPSIISTGIDFTPVSFNVPTRFTVSGLPPSMSFNTTTGRLFGKPSKAGIYTIKVTASNMAGSVSRSARLIVSPLPSYVGGKHVGAVAIGLPTDVNFRLGGRLDISVASTGVFTGSIRLASETIPLTGSINIAATPPYNPTIWIPSLTRTGKDTLSFALSLRDNGQSDGLLTAIAGNQVSIQSWREAKPLPGFLGTYNASIPPDPANLTGPQGHGTVSVGISTTGATTATGRLADDTPFTTTACVGPNGQFLLYQSLYAHGGVVLSVLDITEDAASGNRNNAVYGNFAWSRAQLTGSRFTPASFAPVTLIATGSKYISATSIIMELPSTVNNAALKLSSGGLSSDIDLLFSITRTNIPVLPTSNPSLVKLKLDAKTGRFTGSASITTPDPYNPGRPLIRLAPYQGIIHRNAVGQLDGFGFFTLIQIPDANANPPTTVNTSPIRAGSIRLSRNPPVVAP
jgi:hypothetical protein